MKQPSTSLIPESRVTRRAVFRSVGLAALFGSVTMAGPATARQDDATPDASALCGTGRLRIGQLPDLQEPWRITVEADRSLAVEWRPDAVLVAMDMSCGFTPDQARIRTTFFSADARGLWDPETALLRPLDPGDPAPKELPADRVSWQVVHDALNGLDLDDDDEIGAAGISVRLNSADPQFGPPSVPPETIVVHLTVGDGPATRDIYVDAVDGEIYTFE